MQLRNLLFFGLGLAVGGALILVLCPRCERAPAGLVDGKYLVVQSASGHWIYEAGPNGLKIAAKEAGLVDGKYLVVQSASGHWIYEAGPNGLKIAAKEMSPEGLHAIWELQGAYQPKAILSGTEEIVHLPNTMYRTDTGSFQVIHKFYKLKEGKLVEIPMETSVEGK